MEQPTLELTDPTLSEHTRAALRDLLGLGRQTMVVAPVDEQVVVLPPYRDVTVFLEPTIDANYVSFVISNPVFDGQMLMFVMPQAGDLKVDGWLALPGGEEVISTAFYSPNTYAFQYVAELQTWRAL